MTQPDTAPDPGNTPVSSPTLPLILFVLAALFLPCGLFSYNLISWFTGELFASPVWVSRLSLPLQAVLSLVVIAPLALTTRDPRFRPIYQSWLVAALFAFPATVLRFVHTYEDHLAFAIQIFLTLAAGAVVFVIRRKTLRFNLRPLSSLTMALMAAPIALYPLVVYGALGSGLDTALSLSAGLSFGLLIALLPAPSANHFVLNGLGASATLALLGSAYGFDGNQLMLVGILPAFGFAVAAVAPSVVATTVLAGLVIAGPLAFFDPSEFTSQLGDVSKWAVNASTLMVLLGLGLGLVMWAIARVLKLNVKGGNLVTAALPLAVAPFTWAGAAALFFFLGQPGLYGDRLFVILKDQADVSAATQIADRDERLTFVYQTLTGHASTTQADIRQMFDRFGVHYTPYYLVNAIEVDNNPLVRLYLATRSDVDRVLYSPRLRPLPEPESVNTGFETTVSESPGWNIKMINADRVWAEFGVTGQGIVVGQSDSGVDGGHPALSDAYRGRESGGDYNWFDPWEGTASPNDEGGHGTHTLGTVLGGRGIGVAPGAQWIGCVNLERNLANPALYLDCMQFMLAPFPRDGDPFADGDPTLAAHVLNNSWGCPVIEGCDSDALLPAMDALRAAGIFVVVSAGNGGPACSTVDTPPSLYDSVFSVAAIDRSGDIAGFSSRGPVRVDGSGRNKPDIAAPGVGVFSSLPGGTYGANSGTSMAGPHLAGVVALLWSAQPELIGDIDRTEQIIVETARPYTGVRSGCFDGNIPNTAVGYGIVDAYAAVKMALGK
jgi:hypothetical protein